jgi:hypothetical protein
MQFVPADTEVINFMDDDDVFFPNHVEEGVKGLIKGGKIAYKPQKSYYRQRGNRISLVENVMEPSVFVKAEHVRQAGFGLETTAQHHQWLMPLAYKGEVYVDPEGKPTYICDWGQDIPTFKTSGDPNHPENFLNYEKHSTDKGDGIITPCSENLANRYYRLK